MSVVVSASISAKGLLLLLASFGIHATNPPLQPSSHHESLRSCMLMIFMLVSPHCSPSPGGPTRGKEEEEEKAAGLLRSRDAAV